MSVPQQKKMNAYQIVALNLHTLEKRHKALADHHKLLRQALKSLVESLGPGYEVIYEADNGQQLLEPARFQGAS